MWPYVSLSVFVVWWLLPMQSFFFWYFRTPSLDITPLQREDRDDLSRQQRLPIMPTYEYLCKNCGRFTAFQWMSEKPLTQCYTCFAPVERLISRGGFLVIKGGKKAESTVYEEDQIIYKAPH